MNVKLVFKVLGHILRIESVFLLLPAMVALVYGETPLPFLVTALLLLLLCFLLFTLIEKLPGRDAKTQ